MTQYGDISNRTAVFSVMRMLRTAMPTLVLERFAQVYELPKNRTNQVKMRRYEEFTASTTPLAEGQVPQPKALTVSDYTATAKQYGDWLPITDQVMDFHEDPVLDQSVTLLGRNAGRTIERLNQNILLATTNLFYSNGSARSAVNLPVSVGKLRAVERTLKGNKASQITKVLPAGPDFGTAPVRASYVAVCHTDLESDLQQLAGFIPAESYASQRLIHENEFGKLGGIRFVTTPDHQFFPDTGGAPQGVMKSTTGSACDVYPIHIMGEDAFGVIGFRGMRAANVMVKQPSTLDTGNPLGQNGFVSMKFYHGGTTLNDNWLVCLFVGVSAL